MYLVGGTLINPTSKVLQHSAFLLPKLLLKPVLDHADNHINGRDTRELLHFYILQKLLHLAFDE